jgi:hypothetical protein
MQRLELVVRARWGRRAQSHEQAVPPDPSWMSSVSTMISTSVLRIARLADWRAGVARVGQIAAR